MNRLCFGVIVCLAAALAGCDRNERAAAATPSDVPVFIISIDTLRADRLPMYGYASGSTPALAAFRSDAILFNEAYAQVPLTLPSHASIFTGRQPYEHGVRNNLGYTLDASHATLASALRAKGYATGAAVSSFVLRKETGIAAGFDFFDDYMTHSPLESATSWQRDGDVTRTALEEWLGRTQSARVFGFLHLYEPHSPYSAPAEFSTVKDPYDAEIACADAIVGRFINGLKAAGLYDPALIIILSDHGEGLGDHGEKEHGIFLYREVIRVPLIVKLPQQQRRGETISRPVALTDVFPTVMQVTSGAAGVGSLLASQPPQRTIYSESFYPRLQYGWSELRSLVTADLHYVDAPRIELYRHQSDPAELQNVATDNRRAVAAFRSDLAAIDRDHPFREPQLQDPEDARKLAALGYIGSTVSASGALPDPKDKLEVLSTFGRASDALRTGRYAECARLMERVMRDDPGFVSGWGLLAQAYRNLGRHDDALATLRTQMNHSSGNAQVALALADLLLEMRRYREAREHAELAAASGGAFVHEMLAMIAIAEGDLDAAEKAVLASLAGESDRIQALMLQSQIRHLQNRNSEELALLKRARDVTERRNLPPIRDLQLRLGDALLRERRVSEAEHAFRAETVSFPDNLQAWANLALVVGAQGRKPESREIVNAMTDRNPSPEARRLAIDVLRTMGDDAGTRTLVRGR